MSTAASSNPATGQLNPLFGRKYQVVVALPDSSTLIQVADSDYDPESLRITFDIFKPAIQAYYWDATIVIYNPDTDVIDQLLTQQSQAMVVTVSAGYQNGNYGVIWNGKVFQAFVERANVVDLKLTLYCVIRLPPISDSSGVGETYAALATQDQIVRNIAKLASIPVAVLSNNLAQIQLPRAKTVFGNLSHHLDSLAEDNNMQWWIADSGLNFGSIEEDLTDSSAPALVFSPPPLGASSVGPAPPEPTGTGSIIGTPQQTMYGVSFTVLLDPRLKTTKPLMTVKIDNSGLLFLKRQLGQYVGLLDQSGIYVVAAVRYKGDTRGNEWYTEIQGWTRVGNTLALLSAEKAAALSSGGGSR